MEYPTKLLLVYFSVRGRAQALRYLLEYLQLPYEEKKYDVNDWEEWSEKDKKTLPTAFPNLPYLKDGEKVVTETETIFLYLCKKAGRKDLFGKTEDDEFDISTTRWVINDLNTYIGELVYDPDFEKKRDEILEEKIAPKLSQLSTFLGKKEYLHGYLTYVDFLLYELIEIIQRMKSDFLDKYENLKEFQKNFAEQKFMKDYISSKRYIARPFYGYAVWNPYD